MQLSEILKLSVKDKIMLIEKIWESIDTSSLEPTKTQKKELDKRLERIAKGEAEFFSWNEVKTQLHKRKK